jgi:hypothetical protein
MAPASNSPSIAVGSRCTILGLSSRSRLPVPNYSRDDEAF